MAFLRLVRAPSQLANHRALLDFILLWYFFFTRLFLPVSLRFKARNYVLPLPLSSSLLLLLPFPFFLLVAPRQKGSEAKLIGDRFVSRRSVKRESFV